VVKYCPGGDRESKSEVPSQTKREMLKRLNNLPVELSRNLRGQLL
jgi:hypothetical protein